MVEAVTLPKRAAPANCPIDKKGRTAFDSPHRKRRAHFACRREQQMDMIRHDAVSVNLVPFFTRLRKVPGKPPQPLVGSATAQILCGDSARLRHAPRKPDGLHDQGLRLRCQPQEQVYSAKR